MLGRDFSGAVSALGAGVGDFKVGDAVFGVLAGGRDGTYQEKVAEKAAILCAKGLSLPRRCRGPSAHRPDGACCDRGYDQLKSGETILIQGGAGGVAGFALQLAKHIGARVITTASAANHAYVKSLGADQVIDYNKDDFTRVVKDVDAVFETVGGEVGNTLVLGREIGWTRRLHRFRSQGSGLAPS